jgi:hypothetical protein
MIRPLCFALVGSLLLSFSSASAQAPRPRFEFTRMIAHWDAYGQRDKYLSFVADAEPEVAQVGFYGAHFYSLAHLPEGAGYPAHFPVQGLDECGRWFEDLNRDMHKRPVKVVGSFNVKFLVGDPESPTGPRGFFKFYRDLWNEKELGPRPVADPLTLLERNKDGTPIVNNSYSIGGMKEYWACLNNPHWQAVLKAWAKRGIERGVDGYVANYFYRHDCHCEHCVRAFKGYLRERFTAEQLAQQFAISDLERHVFDEIVSWHDPAKSTPLRREMLRFSQIANKRAYDEVLVKYARSLKPDLLLAQWNHLGDFNQINGDERCLLPADLWAKDEDYLWYSTGDAANSTDLAAGFLGEATLQARYVRGAADDKPFGLGKYENTRIRTAIAELAANGGAPMGFYTRFTDPAAREEIVRYYQFMKRNDSVFHANRSQAEALLLYPRSRVHSGDVKVVETFKQLGRKLLDEHVLFDVLPDDIVTDEKKAAYALVVDPAKSDALPPLPDKRSRFAAPATVRVSASRPAEGNLLHVHFVNYNRHEPEQKRSPGGGIQDEKPIATPEIACEVLLPAGVTEAHAALLTPEQADRAPLAVTVADGLAKFRLPPVLVYGIVELRWK